MRIFYRIVWNPYWKKPTCNRYPICPVVPYPTITFHVLHWSTSYALPCPVLYLVLSYPPITFPALSLTLACPIPSHNLLCTTTDLYLILLGSAMPCPTLPEPSLPYIDLPYPTLPYTLPCPTLPHPLYPTSPGYHTLPYLPLPQCSEWVSERASEWWFNALSTEAIFTARTC